MGMDLSEHPKIDQMRRGASETRSGFQLELLFLAPAPGLLLSSGFFVPSFCEPERAGGAGEGCGYFFGSRWRFIYHHSNFTSSPRAKMTLIFIRSLFLPISIPLYSP